MNKLYLLLGFAVLVGAAIYVMMPRCTQPDQMDVAVAQLMCTKGLDLPTFKTEICQELRNSTDCELGESDREAVQGLFFKKINNCVRNSLEQKNMCTDKYEDLR